VVASPFYPVEVRLLALLLASALTATPVTPTFSFPSEFSEELRSVLDRYMVAAQKQRDSMLGQKVEMNIGGQIAKLHEKGSMRAIRTIDKQGDLSLEVLEFDGDDRVKKDLIGRYLEEEQKSKAYGAMALSPQDYNFQIRAILRYQGQTKYVFDVSPRDNKGKFRGELWLDGQTGMPLREAGQFTKSPNIFLTNLRFIRDYELEQGIAVVKHVTSSADVRLLGVGRAELDINYSNYSRLQARTGNSRGVFHLGEDHL
jgi:hypothetical protein